MLFYLLAYTVSNALAFGALIALGSHGKRGGELRGPGRRRPPPSAGRAAVRRSACCRWWAFRRRRASSASGTCSAPRSAPAPQLIWLVVIGVLNSVIGAYYYLRVIVYMFMKAPEPGAPIAVPMRSGYVVVALVISGYLVLQLGVLPERTIELALAAAKARRERADRGRARHAWRLALRGARARRSRRLRRRLQVQARARRRGQGRPPRRPPRRRRARP